MAAIFNSLKLAQKFSVNNQQLMRLAVRSYASHWTKDWKPGPIPQTDKERQAAAKKYNLFPEEYRVYPDNGAGYGDYPKLEAGYGDEAKDPFYPYDYPENKRNFNEVLHVEADMYGEDRYSLPGPPRFSIKAMWITFLSVMTGCFVVFYWLEDKSMFPPVAAKQYPGKGKKHYLFPEYDGGC